MPTDRTWVIVESIATLIYSNYSNLETERDSEMVETIMTKFNFTKRNAYKYIKRARKLVLERNRQNTIEARQKALFDLEGDIRRARAEKRFADVARSQKMLFEIQGLFSRDINVTTTINNKPDLSKLTIEELKQLSMING